jgi:hypothetical protein
MTNTNAQDREDIIRKVQKLMAIGNDKRGFEAESASALAMATKWLEENGLSMKDVEFDSDNHLKAEQLTEYKTQEYMLWPWEKNLAVVIQNLIAVQLIWMNTGRGYKKFCWCGTKTDAELAHVMRAQLRTNLKLLASGEETPMAKRSFLQGCVNSMIVKARDLNNKRKQAENAMNQSTALVAVKQQEVAAWVKQQHPNLRPSIQRESEIDPQAFYRGKAAGTKVKLTNNKEINHA